MVEGRSRKGSSWGRDRHGDGRERFYKGGDERESWW